MSTSDLDHLDFFQPSAPIPLYLIEEAAKEVKADATYSSGAAPYVELAWSPGCRNILHAYYNDHYTKITSESPEYKIIKRAEVKRTGGKVFALLGGQTFTLPGGSSLAYVAISLASSGQPNMDVIDSKSRARTIRWEPGSIIYLPGTSGLKCSGNGVVICIILALTTE